MIPFNRTKIIATLGPASSNAEVIDKLILAGVDVFRLNFSHGEYRDHKKIIDCIRERNQHYAHHCGVLVDLQGPKLRIGAVRDDKILLEQNRELTLTTEESIGTPEQLFINYAHFPLDVKTGDTVLIDDGKIKLEVISTNKTDRVKAKVVSGGILASRKGVNLPNTPITLPSLTEKDLENLDFALDCGVDWIGLSFVRNATDIKQLKSIVSKKDKRVKVVAKIEKPEALQDIDHVIQAADAIMVARGDLGVELPMEDLPLIQKMLVKKCLHQSKPVIIATQMMESMINSPTPTRAEVNDIANSVLDGADAVMLSGETSVGSYPVEAVTYMRSVITSIEEKGYQYNRNQQPDVISNTYISDSVCYNACIMASQVGAKGIIGMTRSGYTAFKVSAQRPFAGIYVFTDVPELICKLSLVWGVRCFFYNRVVSTDETISELKEILKQKGFLKTGDTIINLASIPLSEQGRTNMIKLGVVK